MLLMFLSRVEQKIFELAVSMLMKMFFNTEGVRKETRVKTKILRSLDNLLADGFKFLHFYTEAEPR